MVLKTKPQKARFYYFCYCFRWLFDFPLQIPSPQQIRMNRILNFSCKKSNLPHWKLDQCLTETFYTGGGGVVNRTIVIFFVSLSVKTPKVRVPKVCYREPKIPHIFTLEFQKYRQNPWCNLFKTLEKIAPWCLFIFSKNKQKPWLGSVSFETWYSKVCFEYWTIFEGYLWAEIFEKEIWPFGQSLIFNVNSYIFKIKDKSQLKYCKLHQTC